MEDAMEEAARQKSDHVHTIINSIEAELSKIDLVSGVLRDLAERDDVKAVAQILREAVDEISMSTKLLHALCAENGRTPGGATHRNDPMTGLPFSS